MCLVTFLNKFADVLKSFFVTYHLMENKTDRVNSDLIKDNYVLIYQLFDETLDLGLPQLTEFNILKEYIRPASKQAISKENEKRKTDAALMIEKQAEAEINSSISRTSTTTVSWRPKGIFYNKNEFFMDFNEHLNFKYNFQARKIIVNHIAGEVECKSFLSGMPVLRLEINEQIEKDDDTLQRQGSIFNNVNYHQCVKLSDIHERSLSFIPPDGDFRLLSYQILHTAALKPLILVTPQFSISYKRGRYRLRIEVKILTTFRRKFSMTHVRIKLPLIVPFDPLRINFDEPLRYKTKLGKVVHNLEKHSITWHIAKLDGLSEGEMVSDFDLTTLKDLYLERDENRLHNRQSKNDLIYFDLPAEVSKLTGKVSNFELSSAIDSVLSTRADNQEILVTVAFELGALLYSGLKVNYLQIHEPRLQFQSFPWVKYNTICENDDYSFVVSDDQIHVDLSDVEKRELRERGVYEIAKSIEEGDQDEGNEEEGSDEPKSGESEKVAEEGENEERSLKELENSTVTASASASKYKYGSRTIDFEEYVVEGEEVGTKGKNNDHETI
ncbi:DEKNAAC104627 [Brettanomyces naardenensis]|uniref:DEKNAAC104627 n=1 Tax=Brettanomyces naardenensis TaxID=13370 RepID=A0A448YR76_BRENA|nr:DEKNAAC104627 [Brettanomyces naardenensis]